MRLHSKNLSKIRSSNQNSFRTHQASDKRRQVMHHFVRQKDLILNTLHIYTPDNIRKLLDRDDPPSFQDLVTLDWTGLTLHILDPQQTEMED